MKERNSISRLPNWLKLSKKVSWFFCYAWEILGEYIKAMKHYHSCRYVFYSTGNKIMRIRFYSKSQKLIMITKIQQYFVKGWKYLRVTKDLGAEKAFTCFQNRLWGTFFFAGALRDALMEFEICAENIIWEGIISIPFQARFPRGSKNVKENWTTFCIWELRFIAH